MAYHPKSLQFLSLLQIIIGSISLIFGIGSAVLQSDFMSIVGSGIWVGVWIIITGMLGFFGSRDRQVPNKCLLGTFMGFAITACVFAGVMIVCYSFAMSDLSRCYYGWYYAQYVWTDCYNSSKVKAGIGIDAVLLIIGVVEFSVSIASSIFCCKAVCNKDYSVLQNVQGQGMHVVYIQPTMGQISTNAGGGAFFVSTSGAPGSVMQAPTSGQYIAQQRQQPATFVPVSQPGAVAGSSCRVNQPRQSTVPDGATTAQIHHGYENFVVSDAKANLIQES